MAKAAQKTVLHVVKPKSNFDGSVAQAFDFIRGEGVKAGYVKATSIIEQGKALMRVGKALYDTNEDTFAENYMKAYVQYLEGWNEGIGIDIGKRKNTDTKDKSNRSQGNKLGVYIKAGALFEDPEKCAPFIETLKAAIADRPLPSDAYQSASERILTVLRKFPDDPKLQHAKRAKLLELVTPDADKVAVRQASNAAAKEKREELAKEKKEAAKTTNRTPAKGSNDVEMLDGVSKMVSEMSLRFKTTHADLTEKLLKAAMTLAKLSAEIGKIAAAEEKAAEEHKASLKSAAKAAKPDATTTSAPKQRKTRGK